MSAPDGSGPSPVSAFTPFEPRAPTAAECVVALVLDRLAAETPSKPFVVFDDGTEWTYAETLRRARRGAAALRRLGVEPGQLILNWLPNGPAQLGLWLATDYLGAVH